MICHDHEPARPWSMAAIRATGPQRAQVACAAAHSIEMSSDGCVWAGSLACKPHFVLQGTGRRRRKRLVELDRPGLGAAAGLSKMGIKHDIASVCPEACESGPPRPVSRCTSEVFEIAVESNQAVVRA